MALYDISFNELVRAVINTDDWSIKMMSPADFKEFSGQYEVKQLQEGWKSKLSSGTLVLYSVIVESDNNVLRYQIIKNNRVIAQEMDGIEVLAEPVVSIMHSKVVIEDAEGKAIVCIEME